MTRRFHLVSIALALTLVAAPMGALPSCWARASAMHVMATGDDGVIMDAPIALPQLGPWSAPCCKLFAAILPAVLLAPESVGSPEASTSGVLIKAAPVLREASTQIPPGRHGSSFQAVLCVFLI